MAALIESRRDTLEVRRRIAAGDVEDASIARGENAGLVAHTASKMQVGDISSGAREGKSELTTVAAASAKASNYGASGGHYASSDGDAASELFASVDSEGLPFLLRPADQAGGAADALSKEDDEHNRLHMESVRQVCLNSPPLLQISELFLLVYATVNSLSTNAHSIVSHLEGGPRSELDSELHGVCSSLQHWESRTETRRDGRLPRGLKQRLRRRNMLGDFSEPK